MEFREEQVSFQNGNIKLAGTLILPSTRGPHAVVIIVPGDFGTSKNYSRYWGHNFAARGIAVLIYDARGSGASTGTAGNNPFGDLADDILAGVRLLKTVEGIDPNRIGLFGFSNSAYFSALAASRSKDVSFLILKASSGVPPWQQETYRVEHQLRLDGFPEEEIKEAIAFTRLKFEAARTGDGWEQLQAMSVKLGNERWFPYTNPPRSLERLRQVWEATFKYDPVPSFEKITCPVLLTYGEIDANVPVQQSISLLEQALKKAGNKDYTVKVFPKGRHDHLEGKTGSTFEAAQVNRVVPNYWDTIAGWLLKRVTLKN
jgi:dipeptidyl aminopeptidase/acylaminoacyl peptidase